MPEPDVNDNQRQRFTKQASTHEDLIQTETIGLVNLSDFRKRRADALEKKELDAYNPGSDGQKPEKVVDKCTAPLLNRPKKQKRCAQKGPMSFNVDGEDDAGLVGISQTAQVQSTRQYETEPNVAQVERKRLGANTALGLVPKSMTKSARNKEAATRELLRKEFLSMQEAVKATEIVIPFVFYDGTNTPGGYCRMKKGDQAWLFLDRSRKVGVELGIGDQNQRRKGWARVGVDDLMLVRGDLIIPHHYEFYHFIVNKVLGRNGRYLFPYEATMDAARVEEVLAPATATYQPLSRPSQSAKESNASNIPRESDNALEGFDDDPNETRVVDRRWYERNKHIFPASTWEQYEVTKDFSEAVKKDSEGNTFFFS